MKFAAVISYTNHEKIADTRPVHREYLGGLKEAGKIFASGPFEDDSGALIIYEADSQEAAEEMIAQDPFNKAGVFESYTIKPWRQVF